MNEPTSAPAALRARVDALMPSLRASLEDLVRHPSVSSAPDRGPLLATAQVVAGLLEDAGARVRFLEVDGAPPAILAEVDGPPGAPSVLLYAHYDVQPPGPDSLWASPAYGPTERNGRLYGRGVADDKAGVVAHLGALRAFEGRPPVAIKVLIEGEEEIGSPHMSALLERYRDDLAADVIVIADLEHAAVGQPGLTTSLRGLVDCVVEVRTLAAGVHSGQFGGAVPDALTVLARLLATLHDEAGAPAIEGLERAPRGAAAPAEADVRAHAGVLEGVRFIGSGTVADRLWYRPAVSVLAIDAPPVAEAINQLIPSARAKVGVRLAPGDDPARAMDALVAHLEAHVPWGAQLEVTRGAAARPFSLSTEGPVYEAVRSALHEAWGVDAVEIGVGGTVPLVAEFADAYPAATIVMAGVGDPTSHIHGPDESLALQELERNVLAEVLTLHLLGASAAP
ncbi:MAG: M20/M25/M40 family metallo-hydrolase [Dehalococcoidia bacterium]|nr:M20/M25/M40 family metallo-hydrolase [Dehalococcoidia bacterium]